MPDYCFRAVKTGIDIVKAVDDLNASMKKDFGIELACGVGVHCGRAVVGNIGCNYRMDYTAIGDVVNVAERLESVAKRGQVLISSRLYEQVKSRFRADYLGEQSLKGRQDTIEVYSLDIASDIALEGLNGADTDRQNT